MLSALPTSSPSPDAPDAPRPPPIRRRGPPAPLNLTSKPAITSTVVDSGPAAAPREEAVAMGQPPDPGSRPRPVRNVKRLSLSISSAHSSQHPSPASPTAPASLATAAAGGAAPAPLPPRRPSIASLPGASAATLLYKDESEANGAPYLDGPIEIMPGVWLGSEDNARDWPGLVSRRIKAILNVAKEVANPIEAANEAPDSALRNFVSTPDLQKPPSRATGTYWHAHAPSGRPAMHYLKLAWSHGQTDLVNVGFVEGMRFVDEALARHEGVLIHCQCGVSRSATMVIALVMRAAEYGGPHVPADILALRGQGMQAAYTYVKNKSKWVGPNMSLIYQLLDYERALRGGSPTESFGASEDEEWERRRRQLDEEPEHESNEVLKEAKALDDEMEERRARKASQGSLASMGSNVSAAPSFTGAVGNGAPWRSRFGHAGFALASASQRTRAGSIGSTYTSRSSISVLSEDPVEEEEEEEEDDTFGSGKNVTTPSTDATDDDAHRGQIIEIRGERERPAFKLPPIPATPARIAKIKLDAAKAGIPPSAPATKQSFTLPAVPPSAPANKRSFKLSLSGGAAPPSAPFHQQTFGLLSSESVAPAIGFKKEKRRPPPLLGVAAAAAQADLQIQVVPSPSHSRHSSTLSSASASSFLSSSSVSSSALSVHSPTSMSSKVPHSSRRKTFRPPALRVPFPSKETPPAPVTGSTPLASQTLFVFPPSPKGSNNGGGKTPSTLMLTTVQTPTLLTPGFSGQGGLTPRALSFTRQRTDGRKSWVSGMAPVTPTTATARVDAKGWFGLPNP